MSLRFRAFLPPFVREWSPATVPKSQTNHAAPAQPADGLEDVITCAFLPASSILYDLITHADDGPQKALQLAEGLLRPSLESSPPSCSSSTQPPAQPRAPAAASRLNQVKAAVALLLGLHRLCVGGIDLDGRACLENLLRTLVGVFVKGGVRAPSLVPDQEVLPTDVSVAIIGAASTINGPRWTVWKLSEHVVEQVKASLPAAIDESADAQLVRLHINLTYLNALFASATTTQTGNSTRSMALFAEVVRLGLLISIHGALPTTPSSLTVPEAHISSLVWKSRKRLELGGDLPAALVGLPNGGREYNRWSGGAMEKTRLAEEAQRAEAAKRKARKALARGRGAPYTCRSLKLRIDDAVDVAGDAAGAGEEGEMLAPPLRLKGKRIAHRRVGAYEPSLCSPGSSSTSLSTQGLVTPSSSLSLRHHDGFLYHAACIQPSTPSPTVSPSPSASTMQLPLMHCRDHSTTSLPSLERRRSIDLLRTPPSSPGQALRASRSTSFAVGRRLESPLKSPMPRPLPTILDSQAIFAVASHPSSMVNLDSDCDCEDEEGVSWFTSIREKVSTMTLRRRTSSATVDTTSSGPQALVDEPLGLPPVPPSAITAGSPSSPAPSITLSLSFTSESTLASPRSSRKPLAIPWTVPSIGFTPSSHDVAGLLEDAVRGGGAGGGLRRGGVLRSFSPVPSRLHSSSRRRS